MTIDWGKSYYYENGPWIDGDCTVNNVQTAFGGLSNGGNVTLESPHASGSTYLTDIRPMIKLDEDDFFYFESNSHGGTTLYQGQPLFYFAYCQQQIPFPTHPSSSAYTSNVFRTDLNSFSCKHQLVVVSACYSDLLIHGPYGIQSGTNVAQRAVVTSDSAGETSAICGLSWSYRIRGNSTSYYEQDYGYADPNNAMYNGGTSNMIKHIKWGYNADDIDWEGWYIDPSQTPPPHIVFNYKEYNTRNIVVSAQEAFNYAKMWSDFMADRDASYTYAGPGSDFSGAAIPREMVV